MSLESISNEELVDEIKNNGNFEKGFRDLVRKNSGYVKGVIGKMVMGDHDVVEDIAQNVFIKAYSNLDKYSKRYKFRTWLYKIARNATIDYLRRERKYMGCVDYKDELDVSDNTIGESLLFKKPKQPDEEQIRKEQLRMLFEEIENLPNTFKEVVKLHTKGLRHRQISEALNIGYGTVRWKAHHGRKLLGKRMRQRELIESPN